MLHVELFVQGLIYGSMYAIIAVGLTLVYGLLRILHVAHAGLFALGGYLGLLLTNATGSLILAFPLAAAGVGVAGMIIYRLCYQPILDRPPYVALIASIGLFISLEEIFRLIFGPYGLTYLQPPLQSQVVLWGINLRVAEVAMVITAVVLLGGAVAAGPADPHRDRLARHGGRPPDGRSPSASTPSGSATSIFSSARPWRRWPASSSLC